MLCDILNDFTLSSDFNLRIEGEAENNNENINIKQFISKYVRNLDLYGTVAIIKNLNDNAEEGESAFSNEKFTILPSTDIFYNDEDTFYSPP